MVSKVNITIDTLNPLRFISTDGIV